MLKNAKALLIIKSYGQSKVLRVLENSSLVRLGLSMAITSLVFIAFRTMNKA